MRKMLLVFLFHPFIAAAQYEAYPIAFKKSIPDSLTQPIHFPPRDYHPFFPKDEKGRIKNRWVHVMDSDSAYRKFFSRYIYTDDSLKKYRDEGMDAWSYNWKEKHHIDSLPVIDFSKVKLLIYAACSQCLVNCEHGDNKGPCHRNRCNLQEAWFVRAKEPDGN